MTKITDFLNSPKILVLGFAAVILIGALLLTLPFSTEDGVGLSFLNALFTATSATCVTGLVVVDTGSTFSSFGEIVILLLIQIGGLGFMIVATFFFSLRQKNITERKIITSRSVKPIIDGGHCQVSKKSVDFYRSDRACRCYYFIDPFFFLICRLVELFILAFFIQSRILIMQVLIYWEDFGVDPCIEDRRSC